MAYPGKFKEGARQVINRRAADRFRLAAKIR
jgi:hypothetical protein